MSGEVSVTAPIPNGGCHNEGDGRLSIAA